jgi:hypothetical protein
MHAHDFLLKHFIYIRNFWVSGLYPSSGIWRNTTFRKLDLFPSSGKKTPTQLGPLERANVNHCLLPPFYLRTETDPVSETSCSFKYRTMDKVHKPRNSLCYSPSSQPFRNQPSFNLILITSEFSLYRLTKIQFNISIYLLWGKGVNYK